jgi:transposase-like protein
MSDYDSRHPECPNCGSHVTVLEVSLTGFITKRGNFRCISCHHKWSVDLREAEEKK